jgi:biotin carboxylase
MKRSRQESVLVLNGGYAEIPMITAARELGYRVLTTGTDPLGIGHSYADRYIYADFSDPSAVVTLAREGEIVGVVSACNDFAAITATRIAEALGLPGHDRPEAAVTLHLKDEFRSTMKKLGLPSIRSQRVETGDQAKHLVGHLQFPLIVKPVDLSGGKGISICSIPEELEQAVNFARSSSRSNHVLVEEYLDGSHHGFTCFIQSGRVVWWFADDEQYFINPFLVAGTSSPTSISPSSISSVINVVESLAKHLRLVDGLVHLQCILSGEDIYIIEACRRCPGDLYPEFVRHATGWNYAQAIVRSELGLAVALPDHTSHLTQIVRHCAMADRNGFYQGTEISPSLRRQLVGRWLLTQPGARLDNFMSEKSEILFFSFSSEREKLAHLDSRDAKVRVIVRDDSP